MTPRLTAAVLVSALIRRIEAEGGHAMVLARGDATAGALLLSLADRGTAAGLRERGLTPSGAYEWGATGPVDPAGHAAYLARRRASDPDLWIVELDHPDAARIAADVLG